MWAAFLSRIWYPFFLTYFEGAEYGYGGYQAEFFCFSSSKMQNKMAAIKTAFTKF